MNVAGEEHGGWGGVKAVLRASPHTAESLGMDIRI